MSLTQTGDKVHIENRTFFISKGRSDKESMEFFQLNEEDTYKPTPVMFICREFGKKQVTASMHFEGLPYKALKWFQAYVEKAWDIELE